MPPKQIILRSFNTKKPQMSRCVQNLFIPVWSPKPNPAISTYHLNISCQSEHINTSHLNDQAI